MKASKTYQVVTPESADYGVPAESGFVFEDADCDLEEVEWIIKEIGYFDGVESFPDIYGVESLRNLNTGSIKHYALHFEGTAEELESIKQLLTNSSFNACK